MSDNVVKIYPENAAKNADNVIEQSIGCFESILMIGYDKDGGLEVRASTNIDRANLLWLVEQAKSLILRVDDE